MAFDPVPLAIDEYALHDANVMRVLSFAAFTGKEGVSQPTALRVTESDTPDDNINVAPGSCSIVNRALGANSQMYVGRNAQESPYQVTPTDSSGGRSDLVIARVENPYLSGEPWQEPSNREDGPYIFVRILENVGSGVTSVSEVDDSLSAIALARLDIPVSTGTIEQSMITDVRTMNQLLQDTQSITLFCDDDESVNHDELNFKDWPTSFNFTVNVPEWATHMSMRASIDPQVRADPNGSGESGFWGDWRFLIDGNALNVVDFDHNQNGLVGPDRTSKLYGLASDYTIPPSMRGTSVTIKSQAKSNISDANHEGQLWASRGTIGTADVTFKQLTATE